MSFIACRPVSLSKEEMVVAAQTAIDINPSNRPNVEGLPAAGIVLDPGHLAVLVTKYWPNKGVKLTVGFMEETPADLQRMILSHMNSWGEFCNVEFRLSNVDPQVRITRSGDGYWSYLGTDILHIQRSRATMCLQGFTMKTPESECRRVIRHEAGHTLGFPHEHMRPEIVAQIDRDKAIAYFRQTQGWSAMTVEQQVLTPLSESALRGSEHADEISIMTYSLPGSITKDGEPILGGKDFSQMDRKAAGELYPRQVVPPPPPPPPPPPDPPPKDVVLKLSLKEKMLRVRLPEGWTAIKLGEENMNQFAAYADQLEALMPSQDASAAPGIGGIIGAVTKLVASLRGGDARTIMIGVRDLLNVLIGEGGESISFQQASATIDWSKLVEILGQILPLILKLL